MFRQFCGRVVIDNFAVEVKFSPTVTVCLLIIILKMYNVNKNIKKNIFCSRIQNLHTVQDRTGPTSGKMLLL